MLIAAKENSTSGNENEKQSATGEVTLLDTVANKEPRFSLLEEEKAGGDRSPQDEERFQGSGGFYGVGKAYANSASFVTSPRESTAELSKVLRLFSSPATITRIYRPKRRTNPAERARTRATKTLNSKKLPSLMSLPLPSKTQSTGQELWTNVGL